MISSPRRSGFSLPEMLMSLVVLGVVLMVVGPLLSNQNSLNRLAYRLDQTEQNREIAQALLAWAVTTGNGQLPLPFNDGTWIQTVLDPAGVTAGELALQAALADAGYTIDRAISAGSGGNHARVFQSLPAQTVNWPVYEAAGPTAELRYDLGVLYMVMCRVGQVGCYPNGVTGIPGDSAILTAANVTTWDVAGNDFAVHRFSTLDLQRQRLRETMRRIEVVRTALQADFQAEFLAASPPDPSINHYVKPDLGTSPDLAGGDPTLNEGCRDGWYDLTSADVNVLALIGLNGAEYARTAWDGRVEFCRDYDPGNALAPDAPPHSGAVRIHASPSQGLAPLAAGGNLVFNL